MPFIWVCLLNTLILCVLKYFSLNHLLSSLTPVLLRKDSKIKEMEMRVKKFKCQFLIIVASLTSYKLNGEKKTIITKYTQFSNVTELGGPCSSSAQRPESCWPPAWYQFDHTIASCWHDCWKDSDAFSIFELHCGAQNKCGQSAGQFTISFLKHYYQISSISYKILTSNFSCSIV